jgi:hypothetical protein
MRCRAGRLSQLTSPELKEKFLNPENFQELGATAASYIDAVKRGAHEQEGWSSSMYGVSKLAEISYSRLLAKEVSAKVSQHLQLQVRMRLDQNI